MRKLWLKLWTWAWRPQVIIVTPELLAQFLTEDVLQRAATEQLYQG